MLQSCHAASRNGRHGAGDDAARELMHRVTPEPGPGLTCNSRIHGEKTVVTVAGEIDLETAPRLRGALSEVIDSGRHRLVLDLSEVTHCDSVGLGVLIGALKRIRHRYDAGHLDIVCQGAVLAVFRQTGLDHVFGVHPDLPDALGRDGPPRGN